MKNFNPLWYEPKVIHKTDSGVYADPYDAFNWKEIGKIPESDIPLAVLRTKLSINDGYNLLSDNCEHFARFVTTGNKESTQVQTAGITGSLTALYFLFRDDN